MVGADNELGARLSMIGIAPLQFAERKRSIARVGGGKVMGSDESSSSVVAMAVECSLFNSRHHRLHQDKGIMHFSFFSSRKTRLLRLCKDKRSTRILVPSHFLFSSDWNKERTREIPVPAARHINDR